MKIKYLQEGDEWDKTKKVTTAIGSLFDGIKAGVETAKKKKNPFEEYLDLEKNKFEYQKEQDKLRQQMQTPSAQQAIQAAQPQTDWGKMAYGDLSKTQIPSLATQPLIPQQDNTWKNNKNMRTTQYYQQGGQMGSQQEVQKFCAEMIEAGIIDEKSLQQLAQKQPETIQQLFAIWKQSGIDGVIQAIQETQKARYGAKLNRLKQLRKVK